MEMQEKNHEKSITDPRVLEKTGKSWEEWFFFLDRFHALGLSQKEKIKLLRENFKLNLWWQHNIVLTYEKERRGRIIDSPIGGFKVSAGKHFEIPITSMYNLWSDYKLRNTWFPPISCSIISESPRKKVRLLWPDCISIIELSFSRVEKNKSYMLIEHLNLPNHKVAVEMKAFWKRVLEKLHESISSELFHTLIIDI